MDTPMRLPALALCFTIATASAANVADFPDLQAALDANPGKVLTLPAGDYPISRKLVLRGDGAGLSGQGRIIQNNPDEPIVEIDGLKDVLLRDVTLTRAPGKTSAAPTSASTKSASSTTNQPPALWPFANVASPGSRAA